MIIYTCDICKSRIGINIYWSKIKFGPGHNTELKYIGLDGDIKNFYLCLACTKKLIWHLKVLIVELSDFEEGKRIRKLLCKKIMQMPGSANKPMEKK